MEHVVTIDTLEKVVFVPLVVNSDELLVLDELSQSIEVLRYEVLFRLLLVVQEMLFHLCFMRRAETSKDNWLAYESTSQFGILGILRDWDGV